MAVCRTSLAHCDLLAPQVCERRESRIGRHKDLIATRIVGVGGDDLDTRIGCDAEHRRCVARDREVDLACGCGLHLRRTGSEGGERDIVGRRVELTRCAKQCLGAALLVADVEGDRGELVVGDEFGRCGGCGVAATGDTTGEPDDRQRQGSEYPDCAQ